MILSQKIILSLEPILTILTILVKNDDNTKYCLINKWKKVLPRVGFEPVMPQVGRYLKQWPTKWISNALPLSYQVKIKIFWSRNQKEYF